MIIFQKGPFGAFAGVGGANVLVDDEIGVGQAEHEHQLCELAQVIDGNKSLKSEEITEQDDGGDDGGDAGIECADDEIRTDDGGMPTGAQRHSEQPGGDGVDRDGHGENDDGHDGNGAIELAVLIGGSGPAHRQRAVKFFAPGGQTGSIAQDGQVGNHGDVEIKKASGEIAGQERTSQRMGLWSRP